MPSQSRSLCVFLSSSEDIDPRYNELAVDVGSQLAARGIELVSGGGSIASMGQLARSVRHCGGRTVGVIPQRLMDWEVGDTDSTELIVTADMRERKAQMDARSDGFLALPGGLGTLEELLEAWVGRSLGMHRKPVVILDPWNDFEPLRHLVERMQMSGFIRPQAAADLYWAADVGDALNFISEAWSRGEGRGAIIPDRLGTVQEWLEAD